jgi:2-polyprenyl-6-methoxyphenol hydroxylase-like FAD-dependent oxidoreductase
MLFSERKKETGKKCLVIGAGPAGSAAAIQLARQGFDVTLVDRRSQIEQKICGECLSPPSRGLLQELGVWPQILDRGVQELDGVTLVGPRGSRCSLNFEQEKPFTVSRPILDHALVEAARDQGATIDFGTTIVQLEQRSSGFIARSQHGKQYDFDFLIGADGRNSWVARELGMAPSKKHTLQHAAVMTHFSQPDRPLTGVEMHVTSWGYVGLNPLSQNLVNVIVVLSPSLLKSRLLGKGNSGLLDFLAEHVSGKYAPQTLRTRMRSAESVSSRVWTVSPIAWSPKKIVQGRSALIGDSAGFVDPFTGEGLYHALMTATGLSRNISDLGLEKGLKKYEKWHKKAFGPEEVFCLLLQKLLPYSLASDYVIRQLGKKVHLNQILAETVADRLPTEKVLSPWFWGRVLWPIYQKEKVSSV